MLSPSDCRHALNPPVVRKGTPLINGEFFHNLDKTLVTNRYTDPDFGYAVKGWKLNWSGEGVPELSVNSSDCVGCACCSLLIDQHPGHHAHTLRLRLPELGTLVSIQLVAIYTPISEPSYSNPCHFDLMPMDSELGWDAIQAALERVFRSPQSPKCEGWPRKVVSPQDRQQALAKQAEHEGAYLAVLSPCLPSARGGH
jgi:hypothetical protein